MTINKQIQIMIENSLKQFPTPVYCKITKVYKENYVDVETKNGNLQYIQCLGGNIKTGATGILVFLEGGFNQCVVIT